MSRPTLPRAVLPVHFALMDHEHRCRALTETIGAALAAFVESKFSIEDENYPETREAVVRAMWLESWYVTDVRKATPVICGDRDIDDIELKKAKPADEDDFVIWARPGRK